MKTTFLIATAALAATLGACNGTKDAAGGNNAAAGSPASESSTTYSGTGKIAAIAGDQVSIAHGPIQGIGWPAMTMTFTASGDMARDAKVGDPVDFQFRKAGSAYALTSLTKR